MNAVAVMVTELPMANAREQSSPHDRPTGELTAMPDPVPLTTTVSLAPVKFAVTVFDADNVTTHGPVALVQAPVQPANVRSGSGVAVSVTIVPRG